MRFIENVAYFPQNTVFDPQTLVSSVPLTPTYDPWFVPMTLDPSPLDLLGHHGNDVGLVFPDHLPEGGHSGGQRALARDVVEVLGANLHVDVAGINVVLVLTQGHPSQVV